MNEQYRLRLSAKAIAGLVLILLGVLFTLDNLGLVDAGNVWDYWPLILIAVGVARILYPRKPGGRAWGAIEVGVGVFFLLRNLGFFWISFHRMWPAALVLLGIYMIWQTMAARRPAPGVPPVGDRVHEGVMAGLGATRDLREPAGVARTLEEFALFGGGDRVVRTDDFRGGHVTAIFGGFDIDLREATIAGDAASIEVFVLFGGVDFRVPESWNVIVSATPILGSSEYKPRSGGPGVSPSKTLYVTGLVLFGGVEVKN